MSLNKHDEWAAARAWYVARPWIRRALNAGVPINADLSTEEKANREIAKLNRK